MGQVSSLKQNLGSHVLFFSLEHCEGELYPQPYNQRVSSIRKEMNAEGICRRDVQEGCLESRVWRTCSSMAPFELSLFAGSILHPLIAVAETFVCLWRFPMG